MVNIRATLRSAESAGVLTAATHARLLELGKGIFYPDRSFPALFSAALAAGLPSDQIEAVREHVLTKRVDRKRLDALELLAAMRAALAHGEPPAPAAFPFSHTDAWEHAMEWAKTQPRLCDTTRHLSYSEQVEPGEGA
jgi:hypothetical protein